MRRYFRAYPAISSRQQGADRLVYNETDLRTVLWQAVDPTFEGERPSTIRLAADIYLTKPIELGAYDYNVTIEGAGKYKIAHSAEYTHAYVFGLPPLADGTIYNVTFSGVEFSLKIANDIFGGDRSSKVHDFNVHECTVTSETLSVPSLSFVFDSTVNATSSNIQFDEFSGISLGTARFSGLFEAGGLDGVHVGPTLYHYRDSQLIFSRSSSGVRCGTGNTSNLSLQVDGGVRIIPGNITLSAAPTTDPLIAVGNQSHIIVEINNNPTGNINLTPGFEGQILVLLFNVDPAVSVGVVLTDLETGTANAPVVGGAEIHVTKNNHAPLNHDIVTFIYHDGEWCEMARGEGK